MASRECVVLLYNLLLYFKMTVMDTATGDIAAILNGNNTLNFSINMFNPPLGNTVTPSASFIPGPNTGVPSLSFESFEVYYSNYGLVLVKEKKTWDEAFEYCSRKYIRLPIVGDLLLNVENVIQKIQPEGVWVAMRFMDRKWLWIKQTPVGIINGPLLDNITMPSCPSPTFRCGARNVTLKLYENYSCGRKLAFVCKVVE